MQNSNVIQKTDFSFLDQENFRQKYGRGAKHNQIRFYVSGIRCGKCIRKLEDLPLSLPGLKQLRVEMGKNLVYAEVDPYRLSFAELAEKIVSLGFKPIPLSEKLTADEMKKREDRAELIRLGFAAACAGNICFHRQTNL